MVLLEIVAAAKKKTRDEVGSRVEMNNWWSEVYVKFAKGVAAKRH